MPPRALMYHAFAKSFGFTQKQVDEDISLEMSEWYLKIETASQRAAAKAQRDAERHARRHPR